MDAGAAVSTADDDPAGFGQAVLVGGARRHVVNRNRPSRSITGLQWLQHRNCNGPSTGIAIIVAVESQLK